VVATESLRDHLPLVMAVRDEVMGDHRAASTLVTVPALARAEWLMEISLVAAR
jgi:2-iminobutanoate/2-iminopropanoate deaminase